MDVSNHLFCSSLFMLDYYVESVGFVSGKVEIENSR